MSNKYPIRILRVAEEDLNEIILFIARDNINAAFHTADIIETMISRLSEHPFLGSTPHDPRLASSGYRYLIVDHYLIFYTVEDNTIYIHRILHNAQDYRRII